MAFAQVPFEANETTFRRECPFTTRYGTCDTQIDFESAGGSLKTLWAYLQIASTQLATGYHDARHPGKTGGQFLIGTDGQLVQIRMRSG